MIKLVSVFLGYAPVRVSTAILAGLLSGLSGAALVALINTRLNPEHVETWMNSSSTFAVLVGVMLLTSLLARMLMSRLANRTIFDLRMHLCEKIFETPLRDLEKIGGGRILATLTQDTSTLSNALVAFPGIFMNAAIVIGCLVYLGRLSVPALLCFLLFLVLMAGSYVLPERRARQHLGKSRESWDGLVESFRAVTRATKELKIHRFRRQSFFSEEIRPGAESVRLYNIRGADVYALIGSVSQVLYFIFIGFILFFMPMLQGVDTGVLIGYCVTVLYMRGPILSFANIIPAFGRAVVAHQKIENLGLSLSGLGRSKITEPLAEEGNFGGKLEFQGVVHTYYREREDRDFMLGPIDLTLIPGEVVFLVGGNGSGKTTLAKMITGLYGPEEGKIFFDNEEVVDENREWYRQNFSVVFSDPYIFETFLGIEGDDLDKKASAYLKELELDHKVEIEGSRLSTTSLSQGQRKRLALLTAYLEDRPIYVFDEWAADQDPLFKKVFYLKLLPELKARGKSVLVISHDDHYYALADRIIKLDYGKLDFQGVPADLPTMGSE